MANTKPIGVAYEDQNIIGADTILAASILSTGIIGYAAGGYGSVTQSNNKTTGVTINKFSGQIVTANSQMAPSANAVFVVTCNDVSQKDNVIISVASGGTVGAYNVFVAAIADGSFTVVIKNITNNAYAEALTLNFTIFHTVT